MATRMTWWVLLGALAVVPGQGPVAAQSADGDMVPNPSAEVGAAQPEGWTSRGKATFAWGGEAAHDGQRSLKIRYSDVDAEWSSSPFKVDGSYATEYPWVVVSAWVKTERTSGLTYLRISWWRDGQEIGEGRTAPLPHGTADWARVRLAALPAAGATEGRVGLCSQGNVGAAWFDDVATSLTTLPASRHSLGQGEPVASPYQAFLDEYPKASWAADALERLLALDEAAGRWEDVVDRLRLRAKAAAAAERADWQARLAEALIAQAFSETAKGQTDTNARRQGSATADFDAAAKICRSALEQVDLAAAGEAPEAGRRHKLSLLRAQCAEGQGELEKAISLYDAAAADDPSLSNEAAYRAAMVESPVPGRRDAPTLSRCRQALQRVRPRLVDDPCGQGMLLALDLALAETGFFLKQYDKSIEEFRWVIDHNPVTAKQERAQFFTGQVYFHTKRFTEAMGEYAKLDRARDADIAADVYLHRGRALIALGGFSEMGSWIKGQEGRFPAGAESLHLLWAEGLYAAKRYQDALGVCEQFISMTEEGRQVRAIWLHAAVLTALGRRDEARQMALKLRESHPDWRETAEALLLLVAGLAKGRR